MVLNLVITVRGERYVACVEHTPRHTIVHHVWTEDERGRFVEIDDLPERDLFDAVSVALYEVLYTRECPACGEPGFSEWAYNRP